METMQITKMKDQAIIPTAMAIQMRCTQNMATDNNKMQASHMDRAAAMDESIKVQQKLKSKFIKVLTLNC